MAKLSILAGTTSKMIDIFVMDSSSTTGAGLTGLTNASSGLTWYYYREGAATSTQVTSIASMTLGTWTSKGFIVIDGTNMPGCYQLGVPDAAITSGAKSVIMLLKGVTNMAPLVLEIELTSVDNQDATAFGLSRLDAAVTTRMATYTQPTGFLAATFPSGTVANTTNITSATGIDVTKWLGGAIPAVNVTGVPLIDLKYTLGTISPAAAGSVRADAVTGAVGSVTAAVTLAAGQKVDVDTIKTNPVVNAGTVTYPTNATLASTTNITSATGIDVTKWLGGTIPAVNITGVPLVDLDAILGDTTSAATLKRSTDTILYGTCSGGTTTTAIASSIVNPASLTDAGQLIGRTIIFLGNTGTINVQAQASNITASTTGATPTISFTAMTHAPANGDVFVVI